MQGRITLVRAMNCGRCAWQPRSAQSAVRPTALPSASQDADIKDTEGQALKQMAKLGGNANRPFGDWPVENRTLQMSVSTKRSRLYAAEGAGTLLNIEVAVSGRWSGRLLQNESRLCSCVVVTFS
jgi:hypothetical protein